MADNIINFEKILEQYKSFAELQEYSKAQYRTILDLNKKLNKAQEEINHLKQLVTTASPSQPLDIIKLDGSEQENICRFQLVRLSETATTRELTLEEARKVEIYSRILKELENKPKTFNTTAKDLSEKELLALAQNDNNVKN